METSGQIYFSSSGRIFQWWTISTLGVNIAISALILLFLMVGLGEVRETGGLMDMLIFFYHMVKEGGGMVGAIYLLIFGSNAVLFVLVLYHKCKSRQLDEKPAIRTVMSNIAIKSWTVLILLIDIAAIVFPILTMVLRRSDVSYATTHGEVYTASGSSSSIDQWLHFCVFLWVLIFTSNTLLLFHSLFHKCDRQEQTTSAL